MTARLEGGLTWRAMAMGLVALALALPVNLGFNQMPAPAQWNILTGVAAWALFIAVLGGAWPRRAPIKALGLALALMAAGIVASMAFFALPAQMAALALALLLAAYVHVMHGVACARSAQWERGFVLFCSAWWLAGVLAALAAIVQLLFPELTSDPWIVPSNKPGRAIGNMRQPNHLAAVQLWALVASLAWMSLRPRSARVMAAAGAVMALLVTAIVCSASRTGLLGVVILAAWGLLDRRLAIGVRVLALSLPLIYAVAWTGISAWAETAGSVFAGDVRLQAKDLSSSRFALWANVLQLIRQQPWTGVGFGNFNLAWTLTPMAGRPQHLFDQSHNLPLQLLVDFGLPLGGLILGMLLSTMHRLARLWSNAETAPRAATVMVLLMAVYSLLEYPLWYSYFLLPTAWALGFALSASPRPELAELGPQRGAWVFVTAGLAMIAASVGAGFDYRRVTPLFASSATTGNWHARLSLGRQSLLFAHYADYAAVVSRWQPDTRLQTFDAPVHHLLDKYLMVAWTQALAKAGRTDEARHLAARMREFKELAEDRYFESCRRPRWAQLVQCEAPVREVRWTEYLNR